jgi:hypothetical protein
MITVAHRNIAVPVNVAKDGKLAQTVFLSGTEAVSFETQAFQFLDSERGHRRFLSY